jgi:hypothetical protein
LGFFGVLATAEVVAGFAAVELVVEVEEVDPHPAAARTNSSAPAGINVRKRRGLICKRRGLISISRKFVLSHYDAA